MCIFQGYFPLTLLAPHFENRKLARPCIFDSATSTAPITHYEDYFANTTTAITTTIKQLLLPLESRSITDWLYDRRSTTILHRHTFLAATIFDPYDAARIQMVSPMTLPWVMTSPKTLQETAFPWIRLHRMASPWIHLQEYAPVLIPYDAAWIRILSSMTLSRGMTSPKIFLQPFLQQRTGCSVERAWYIHGWSFRPLHRMVKLNYGSLSGEDLIGMWHIIQFHHLTSENFKVHVGLCVPFRIFDKTQVGVPVLSCE
jgi:hypothetical protein